MENSEGATDRKVGAIFIHEKLFHNPLLFSQLIHQIRLEMIPSSSGVHGMNAEREQNMLKEITGGI